MKFVFRSIINKKDIWMETDVLPCSLNYQQGMEPHCSTPTPTKTSHRFTCTRNREQAYLVASVRWSAPVVGCSSSVQAGAQRPHRGELISIKPRARDAHSQPSANPLLRRGLPKFLLPFFLWIFFLLFSPFLEVCARTKCHWLCPIGV